MRKCSPCCTITVSLLIHPHTISFYLLSCIIKTLPHVSAILLMRSSSTYISIPGNLMLTVMVFVFTADREI